MLGKARLRSSTHSEPPSPSYQRTLPTPLSASLPLPPQARNTFVPDPRWSDSDVSSDRPASDGDEADIDSHGEQIDDPINEPANEPAEKNTSHIDESFVSADMSAELDLGPQMTPYVRRQVVRDREERRSSHIRSAPSRTHSSGGPAVTSTTTPSTEPLNSAQQQPQSAFLPPFPFNRLSMWRQEQLRNLKTSKITSTQMKRITALYGPLSLPYARNPSGVDATLPEDDIVPATYQTSVDRFETARSTTTTAVVPLETRSSVIPIKRPHEKVSTITKSSNPLSQLDMNQNGNTHTLSVARQEKSKNKENARPSEHIKLTVENNRPALAPLHLVASKLTFNPVSPSPKSNTKTVLLGLGVPSLPTIPGSPSVETHQEVPYFSDDLHNSAAMDFAHLHFATEGRKVSDQSSNTNTFGSRVTSDSTQTSNSTNALLNKSVTLVEPSPSKADSSKNWRMRPHSPSGIKGIRFSTPARTANKDIDVAYSPPSLSAAVMTIDALFEKFSMDDKAKVPFKAPPVGQVVKHSAKIPITPVQDH
ncbi:hypothetical protein M231_02186 [Tremella mesenterica]|uniref:Uncharacterized protein n=1 Tax=Tremella mesenterica TaxID=5217 RepID=A0A4Q1BRE7_TREME|nr:hypothetical protein M231_02186 [Tremella mesenterica]